jgi:hypothetical protein
MKRKVETESQRDKDELEIQEGTQNEKGGLRTKKRQKNKNKSPERGQRRKDKK